MDREDSPHTGHTEPPGVGEHLLRLLKLVRGLGPCSSMGPQTLGESVPGRIFRGPKGTSREQVLETLRPALKKNQGLVWELRESGHLHPETAEVAGSTMSPETSGLTTREEECSHQDGALGMGRQGGPDPEMLGSPQQKRPPPKNKTNKKKNRLLYRLGREPPLGVLKDPRLGCVWRWGKKE